MEKYQRHPNCQCKICQKDIYKRPSEIEKGSVYCSRDCYGKSCTILVKCAVCSELIKSGLNKKTCSRACANKQKIGLIYKQTGKPMKDKVKALESLRNRLIELNGNLCSKCSYNKYPILHVHHIVEKSKGGTDDINNLELICSNCHYEEHYLRLLKNREACVSPA